MPQPAFKHDHFTYADYRRWPEDERWELIDGTAYDMCPAPTRGHQRMVLEIATQAHAFLRDGPCEVDIAPFDVRLPRADEADEQIDTVVQPDITVVCDETKLDDAGCRGAPDWVVEVLSPRTAAKDQGEKRDAYERAGVREYWLVHPTDLTLMIYRLGPNGTYGRPVVLPLTGETAVAAIPGLSITWPSGAGPSGDDGQVIPSPR
jgi:Uma2 family endonuclease